MANAKKTINKIGGPKKNSARRSSSTRRKKRVRSRWKYVTAIAIIAICILVLAYPRISVPYHRIYGSRIPKGYSVYGIDVSHHQGEIDWKILKRGTPGEPPIDFVYIKATEGSSHCDTRFDKNWKEAGANGFIRGAYHYFSTSSTGEKQARLFISKVELKPGDLPPMVDVEDEPKNADAYKKELKTFITIIEDYYKVKPIIYTYKKFNDKYIDNELFRDYPLWIARYNIRKPSTRNKWIIWQCTEDGRLPGIGRKVDINLFNGTIKELNNLKIK